MSTKLTFLGAAKTVTGSKFLLSHDGFNLLIDCGMYQGREKPANKDQISNSLKAKDVQGAILTHSHLDHCGLFPKLVKDGFKGPIICTKATKDIAPIILQDAANIQKSRFQREKKRLSRHNKTKAIKHLKEPIYDDQDVALTTSQLKPLDYNSDFKIGPFTITLHRAGHIPGAASVGIKWNQGSILFSGDLGRYNDTFALDPQVKGSYDHLVIESTYGGNFHPPISQIDDLTAVFEQALKKAGTLFIPAFSLARTQAILFLIEQLYSKRKDLRMPVFLDGPMARKVNEALKLNDDEFKGNLNDLEKNLSELKIIQNHWETELYDKAATPKVIIAASGMLSGGRAMHYLKELVTDPEAIIFLPGHQAEETLGASLVAGSKEIEVEGQQLSVNAQIVHSTAFSAHADEDGLITWIKNLTTPPKNIYLVHGEVDSLQKFKERISRDIGESKIIIPERNEVLNLED